MKNLVANLGKDNFTYFSQEFDSKVLDLPKQKRFCCYEYMSDFKKFKEELPSKEKFYSSMMGEKFKIKSISMMLRFGIDLKWKQWKIFTICI